jgi:uroporphyrinogen decarboxylase
MENARNIINGLLSNRPADRMGLYEFLWPDTAEKWLQDGYPKEMRENEEGEVKELPVEAPEYFDYDMFQVGGWFDSYPLRGYKEVIEESDEWIITKNGGGGILKNWKHKSGTPEHIDFTMTSRKIWDEQYRPHLLELDRDRLNIDFTRKQLEKRREQGYWTHYGQLFIVEQMRRTMGDVCMFESLLLDKEWIHDFCRVYTDMYKTHFTVLFEEAGVPDGMWLFEDLGYKNSLFCSPATLEEMIFPYFTELVAFFHSYNLPVVLHSCGSVGEALPLIINAGFDALNPIERKAEGNNPVEFVEQYGDKLAFVGGFDERIFESGDRDLMKRELIKYLNDMKSVGARLIFASDHSISTNVEFKDYRYALEVIKDNLAY